MNADHPPSWLAISAGTVLCGGCVVGLIALAVVLLTRRPSPPRRRDDRGDANPALRAVGMFLLLVLGLTGAGLFAFILYIELSTDFVHFSPAAWLIPLGSIAARV